MDFIRTYPRLLAVLSFLLIGLPSAVIAWWSLVDKVGPVSMPNASIGWWISAVTVPLGLVLLGTIFYQTRSQPSRPRSSEGDTILVTVVGEEEEKGFLDFLVQAVNAMQGDRKTLSRMASEVSKIGKLMKSRGGRIERRRGNPVAILEIANDTARRLLKHSDEMGSLLRDLQETGSLLTEGYTHVIERFEPKTTDDKAELGRFREKMLKYLESVRLAHSGTKHFGGALGELRGISQSLNSSTNALSEVIEGVIDVMDERVEFGQLVLALVDGKLDNAINT